MNQCDIDTEPVKDLKDIFFRQMVDVRVHPTCEKTVIFRMEVLE